MQEVFKMIKTQGIILKTIDQGEADRALTVLTHDFGKLNFLGRAVRKITSKLRSGLQLFSLVYFEFVPGKINGIITETQVLENFPEVKNDLKKLQAGFYICRLLDKFLKENEKDENIWNLTILALDWLEDLRSDSLILGKLLRYFEFQLIKFLGYPPELYSCVICGRKLNNEKDFLLSLADGGVVCQQCRARKLQKSELTYTYDRAYLLVSSEIIRVLRLFFGKGLDFLEGLNINKENLEELKKISKSVLEHILEEKLI